MKCPLPSAYPACIIAVILREFALFFSFYNLSTILAYKTIFIIKFFRGGVILHALLLSGGGSLYLISIFLIHDIRIYEPQSGMSFTAFAGMQDLVDHSFLACLFGYTFILDQPGRNLYNACSIRIFRKRQTIRLTLNQRRFISGAVFCIRPEGLQPKASSDPDQQDLYFPVHHKVLAAP